MKPQSPQKLPLHLILVFALGQMGWSLAAFSVSNLLTYFYMPPEDASGVGLFPSLIPQGAIFLSLTLLGILNFGSRLFDAVKDPLIAHLSDRSQSKFGRRRLFLLIGCTPLAAFSFLTFYPPDLVVSSGNIIWLAITLLCFYISFSLYVTPFNALIAEYGHNAEERLNISTWISVTWALGFALGNQVYGLQAWAQNAYHLSSLQAFQYVLMGFGLLSWILMLLPVIAINERKYASFTPSNENIFSSLKATWKDINFRYFLFSDLFYWLSLTFIQLGMNYYILVLLELPAPLLSGLMLLLFALSFVFYAPINMLAKRIGKRPLLIFAFCLLALVFVFASQLGKWPIDRHLQAYAIAVLASLPLAIFGILPNALIADLAQDAADTTGSNRTAMYYGTRTLAMKLGISGANLIFPSLLLAGKGVGNDLGIRLTAYTAIGFGLMGLFCYQRVHEKQISPKS